MTTTLAAQVMAQHRRSKVVMVRGFRGRPYRVVAIAANETTVQVTGSEESPGIGYPAMDVFDMDDRLFEALEGAAAQEKRDEIWSSATRFIPASLPVISPTGHLE